MRAAGFEVNTVADLFNAKMNYATAIPILLSWLPRVQDPAVKEDIVRSLTVTWAKPDASPLLMEEFRHASTDGLRWAIANALSVVADDTVFDELVELINDRRYGKAREMLAVALGNMKNPKAFNVLIDLLADEQVVGHAVIALGMLKAKPARPFVQELLSHPKKWIRTEAKKAISQIDSAAEP